MWTFSLLTVKGGYRGLLRRKGGVPYGGNALTKIKNVRRSNIWLFPRVEKENISEFSRG